MNGAYPRVPNSFPTQGDLLLMPLTPIDIQQKTFGPELRGYNMDEVDDFLDEVVTALKDYDQRVRDAQDRIRALEAELSTRGEDESAISRALVAAQKQADALVTDAHAEAERIRGDAQVEADQLRADRDTERMSLTQDIARMRATVADLKRRMSELAASAGSDLDAMDEAAAAASVAVGGEVSSAARGPVGEAPLGYDEAEIGEGVDVFGRIEVDEETADESVEDDLDEDRPGQHLSDYEEDLDDIEVEVDSADPEGEEAEADLSDLTDPDLDVTEPSPGRRPWERGSV
jgi:cell division initiation protein